MLFIICIQMRSIQVSFNWFCRNWDRSRRTHVRKLGRFCAQTPRSNRGGQTTCRSRGTWKRSTTAHPNFAVINARHSEAAGEGKIYESEARSMSQGQLMTTAEIVEALDRL